MTVVMNISWKVGKYLWILKDVRVGEKSKLTHGMLHKNELVVESSITTWVSIAFLSKCWIHYFHHS